MEEIFSSVLSGFMKGISENDKKRMMACGERMAAMCSCMKMKDMSGEEKKAMMGKMMSAFLKQMGSEREQTGGPKNE